MKARVNGLVLLGIVVMVGATPTPLSAQNQRRTPVVIYAPARPTERPRRDRPADDEESSGSSERSQIRREGPGPAVTFTNILKTPGAFTQTVLANNGQVRYPIRLILGNRLFRARQYNAAGHHYLSFSSLGRSALSPEQIMSLITQDLNTVFPYFQAVGGNGQRVQVGNTFSLTLNIAGYQFENPVEVTEANPYTFTLKTLPGHYLQGTATHGVFKDSTGELWLFQEGIGVPDELEIKQANNYDAAEFMWPDMAQRVRGLMSRSPRQ